MVYSDTLKQHELILPDPNLQDIQELRLILQAVMLRCALEVWARVYLYMTYPDASV